MVKSGPCYHCGITSTPLWRNGPPEKPVLCNACGTRWRIRGTLADYTPLHSLAPCEIEKNKSLKLKTVHGNVKADKLQKTKHRDNVENEYEIVEFVNKGLYEEKSNHSSSGSAVSYAESCAYFGAMDVSCTAGSAQSNSWESFLSSQVTVSRPKALHVENLTKDLNHILHQQSQSLLSAEEDLLYENGSPMGSTEIGHGGFLIKSSNSASLQEEKKTSPVPEKNKSTCSVRSVHSNVASSGSWNSKMGSNKFKRGYMTREHLRRNKSRRENFHIQHRDSWLGTVDLKDVINFDVYTKHLTLGEQQQLLKYLPSVDTAFFPGSLKSFFTDIQLEENMCWLQQLIQEGIFDLSFPFANSEECTSLKKLILLNLSKSSWLEYYKMLTDTKINEYGENGTESVVNVVLSPVSSSLERANDSQMQPFQESKAKEKSPRTLKPLMKNVLPLRSFKMDATNSFTKSDSCADNSQDSGGSWFGMNNQFTSSSNASSIVNLLPLKNNNTDQDLVLDVRSDSSFPKAELLSDRKMTPSTVSYLN